MYKCDRLVPSNIAHTITTNLNIILQRKYSDTIS